MQILKCSICGKNPKIRLGGYGFGQYPHCDIYCKPFLKKGTFWGYTFYCALWNCRRGKRKSH